MVFHWYQKPRHFRCGFDIIVPWDWKQIDDLSSLPLPNWFHHQLGGRSIIRIVQSNVNDNWIGFSFCVAFEVNNRPASSGSSHGSLSSALPHPFFLSFESEHTEERFDMPLGLELDKIDGSKHLWIIYISREHCHFVKTGAHITFKACPGLMIKKWGLHMLIKKAGEDTSSCYSDSNMFFNNEFEESEVHHLMFDYVEESISRSGPKIQLPYNWLITEEEEVENSEAKSKEIDLSNLGL